MMIDPTQQYGATWTQRLSAEIKRKPRSALVFVSLLLVLCVMWARMLLGGGVSLPAAASAMFNKADAQPAPNANPADVSYRPAARTLAEWAQQPTGPVKRNLFAVPFDGYPVDPANPMPQTRESAKSGPSEADQSKERQIVVERVRNEAAKLSLGGIILGASPKVLVNGSLLSVGQAVGETGFKVVRIDVRQILVERDGVQVELKMK
jgi:hypothetical protein